jgi:hypothetical protein
MNTETETPATPEPTPTLIQKLARVVEAVERIPKRGHNTFHGYDYATEGDIVAAIREELAKRNIMLIPSVQNHERHDVTTKKGERGDPLTVLHMTFTFVDGETGEREAHAWLGVGQDGGDKGAYKAMTGAAKYFLLKTFLMPTGDDPEAEAGEPQRQPLQRREEPRSEPRRTEPARQREPGDDDEPGYRTAPQQAPPAQAARPAGNGGGNGGTFKTISDAQSKRLFAIAKSAGMVSDDYAAFLRKWDYEDDRKIRPNDYDQMVEEARAFGR